MFQASGSEPIKASDIVMRLLARLPRRRHYLFVVEDEAAHRTEPSIEPAAPASPEASAHDTAQSSRATAPRRRNGPISRRLLAIARTVKTETLTVGDLSDRLETEGLGLTLLLLTLPALIPLPGPFGIVFGTLVAAVAVQILFGAERLWLPGFLRRRPVPQRILRNVIRAGLDWAEFAERGLRENRMIWLTGRRARMLLALPLLLMAVTIVLPIPLGNLLPALALIAAAIGFMAYDGLAVLVSILIAIAAVIWIAILLYAGAAAIDYASGVLVHSAAYLRGGLDAHGVSLAAAMTVTDAAIILTTLAAIWFWYQVARQSRQRHVRAEGPTESTVERSQTTAARKRGLIAAAAAATVMTATVIVTRLMLAGSI
jgi:hypothetical protein